MKHHRLSHFLAVATALFTVASNSSADVIIMKDGKKYEKAQVKSETADSVTFEYFVAGKIKDTRTEPKANIQQVVRQRPEELEVVELRKVIPSADLLTADKYEQIITDTLRPFVSKYPGSPEAAEVEKIIKTLQEEKEKVVSGQLKMEGKWLDPDMVKRQARAIEAYKVRSEMLRLSAEGDYKAALIVWEKLADRIEGFTDTVQFVSAIPEVLGILDKYKEVLTAMLREQPLILKRRTDNIKGLVEPDLSRTKRAIDAEIAAFEDTVELEKKTRVQWLTVYKYNLKSIEGALKHLVDTQAEISSIEIAKLKEQNEALAAVQSYLADENFEEAEAAMKKAMAVNLRDMHSEAVTNLKKQITELKAKNAKKRQADRMFSGNSSRSSSSKAVDDRVQKITAEQKDKDDKAAAAEQVKIEAAAKAQREATERKAKRERLAEAASARADEGEEGGFTQYLIFGGGGLLAVLLGAMFMQKKKVRE